MGVWRYNKKGFKVENRLLISSGNNVASGTFGGWSLLGCEGNHCHRHRCCCGVRHLFPIMFCRQRLPPVADPSLSSEEKLVELTRD